jgi:hypothetical protein
MNAYWPRLVEELPDFQFHVLEGHDVLARARSLPIRWNGNVDDLPAGIDGAMIRGFEEGGANVLCALLISVPSAHRKTGASRLALAGMVEVARRHGLDSLIAPVRPSWKDRYPLTPIDGYASWRRGDGFLFDPWLRIHERAGGEVLKTEPNSLRITGTVAEWEEWTKLPFPESGEYVFPGGLATLAIDRGADIGRYWEPNVWMLHRVA